MRIFLNDYGGYPFPVELSEELARRGHDVEHAYCPSLAGTPQGNFLSRPSIDGLAFRALKLARTQQKLSFLKRRRQDIEYGRLAIRSMNEFQPEVVVSANTPLDAQRMLLARCREQNIPFVHWWQDVISLAIDAVLRRKMPGPGHMIGRYYRSIERKITLQSDHVIAIADNFQELFTRWGGQPNRSTVVPNWGPINELPIRSRDNAWSRARDLNGKFVFLYSGTLSLKHNPRLLMELARACRPMGGIVLLRSTGAGADWLIQQKSELGLDNLIIEEFGPFSETPDAFGTADVLVAVLEPEAGEYSVPSKVLAYLCAARPLLLSVPKSNAAARIVQDIRCGFVAAPGDCEGFIESAIRLMKDHTSSEKMGHSARAYAQRHFNIQRIGNQFESLLERILKR